MSQEYGIGILLTSRNNYEFMEKFWIPKTIGVCDLDCKILNIDEDSNEVEKQRGRELCKKHNISYMDREEPGMHHNIDTAIRFFGESVKYIIWFQHDCWPLQKDFFVKFNKLVKEGHLENFGTIGFNSIAKNIFKKRHKNILEDFRSGKKPLGVLSRSNLEQAGGKDWYYCGIRGGRIKNPVNKKHFCGPSAIAVPVWYAIAVNTFLFKKEIDINRKFYFFKSWDDISFQFLSKNIYNIVLPDLYIEHRPDLKRKVGLPRLSVSGVKKNDKYHSISGHHGSEWIKQWGWNFDKPITFEKVRRRYRGTLLRKFYKYDYTKGPLKTFKL